MRALVLGGGGHVGAAFVHHLTRQGAEVRAATRHPGPRPNIAGLAVERVHGDDADPARLEDWCAGRDLIVDAAAPYALSLVEPGRSRARRLAEAEARMQAVLDAAARAGAVLIHVGSFVTRLAGQGRGALISAAHPYFAMKAAMEARAIAAARRGQPVVIVNPTTLFGPGNMRPTAQNFTAAVLEGRLAASFPDTVNVLDVRDAAALALAAAEAGHFGQPLPLAGTNVTIHRLAAMIADIGAVPRPPRARGMMAGAAALYWTESALALAGVEARYPSLPVLLALACGAQRQTPAQQALGVELRPLARTLADEISWTRRAPARPPSPPAAPGPDGDAAPAPPPSRRNPAAAS